MNRNSNKNDIKTVTRRGKPDDAQDFSRLILLSGATLFPTFGKEAEKMMIDLFLKPKNIYSMDHTLFVVAAGKTAGMILGYSWEDMKSEQKRTRELMIISLKLKFYLKFFNMRKVQEIFGNISRDEFILSNIAIYPEVRGMGLAISLISEIEKEAKTKGSNRIVLDVETDNKAAVGLYKKLGFDIEKTLPRFTLNNKSFEFFRMIKIIHS